VYILGNSIGLSVEAMNVLKLPTGRRKPADVGHVACLVRLSDGKAVAVDAAQKLLSAPFAFNDAFVQAGDYWELDPKNASNQIPRRVQLLNQQGLTAEVYNLVGLRLQRAGQ